MGTFVFIWRFTVQKLGGFGLEEKSKKTKVVCGLRITNYGGLRNVRPPIIDPIHDCLSRDISGASHKTFSR